MGDIHVSCNQGDFEKIFTCIKGVFGCRKFWFEGCCQWQQIGPTWVRKWTIWVIRDSPYWNIWIMGRFGQPSLCIRNDSPPVILGYDMLRRYNESRNWKLLIQMQLERDELTWNFPVQDRSSWGNIPPGQITLMNIFVGYFCLDIWSFCHLQNLVYYFLFTSRMKGGFKSVGCSRISIFCGGTGLQGGGGPPSSVIIGIYIVE